MLCPPNFKASCTFKGNVLAPYRGLGYAKGFFNEKTKIWCFSSLKKRGRHGEEWIYLCRAWNSIRLVAEPQLPHFILPKGEHGAILCKPRRGKKKKLGENAAVLGHFAGSRNFSLTCESQRVVPATRCQHNGLVAQHLDELGGFHALGVPVAQLPLLIAT